MRVVCPHESTVKDVPDDGEASELRCDYIGKSVDEADLIQTEASVPRTQLLEKYSGEVLGVFVISVLVDRGAIENLISEHLVSGHG